MKERTTNSILILLTLSIIFMAFVYQCHPTQSSSRNLDEYKKETPPLKLDDIKEGALVRKIDGSDLYEMLPGLETRVQINIEGMVASTTVEQVFSNTSEEPIEAVYVFPLPQNAAVNDMKMLINDRLIQGVIKEKAEARETYEKAKAEGRRAGLTEQERPNIFTNTAANIMPGDTIIVRLQFIDKLTYEEGTFRLRFPMVVAPRFIPGYEIKGYSGSGWAYDTDIVPDASHITPPVVPPGMRSGSLLSLQVNINAGIPLSSINSISHDTRIIQINENAYRIDLKKNKVIPNKDFVLQYSIKSGKELKAALFTAEKEDDTYFMLMAVPPVNTGKDASIKKEIIFVLDISGSMSGASIKQAGAGLINALGLLSQNDYFNIIAFNDRYETFAPFSVQASAAGIMSGINYVNSLNAGGGTQARPALEHALRMPHQPDALKMIVFLTDGSVGNEDQLIALVNRDIGNSRLFTVGIGSAPNGFLLEKVSRFGRGTFTFISTISEVQKKINELFAKIENPVLMDLKLDISQKAEIFPYPIADLFAGQPLIVFGKTDTLSETSTKLSGRTPDGIFALNIPLDRNSATKEPAIPTLWARNKIAGLMDEYRLGDEKVKREIIDLAIHHKLITKFTSFVAVEHKIINPKGKARLSTIPVELPEGWEYEKVFENEGLVKLAYLPQTASDAPLIALAGFMLMITGVSLQLLVRKMNL
jgi:Ca-activated chloride channel family protein